MCPQVVVIVTTCGHFAGTGDVRPAPSRGPRRGPLLPVGFAGQLLGDPVVKALALQGPFDVGDDLAQRVGDLRLDLGDGGLGGPPLGGQPPGDASRLGRERHLLAAGIGARSKRVALTAKAGRIVGRLAAEWQATEAAIAEIEAEIPYPLSRVVTDIEEALQRKSFHDRIAEKLTGDAAWT